MKRYFKLVLLCLVITCFAFKNQTTAGLTKLFVGYYNGHPVFDSPDENSLYVLNDKLDFLTKYPQSYRVLSVSYPFISYSQKVKNGNNLIISYNKIEKKYVVLTKLGYTALDKSGNCFYTDQQANNEIKQIVNDKIVNTGIKGYVFQYIDGYLYFYRVHDKNIEGANADIFVIDIKNHGQIQKILNNVAGEKTFLFSDRKYIYDEVLTGGEYKPIIYSVENQKYTILKVDKKFRSTSPYYSFEKKCLVFYDSETFDKLNIEIPSTFNLSR